MEQNKENTSSVSRTLKEYFIITVAVLIMDIGIYVFKFPNNFSFGGVSGMAVVFAKCLPFTASVINLVINLVLLVVGFVFPVPRSNATTTVTFFTRLFSL